MLVLCIAGRVSNHSFLGRKVCIYICNLIVIVVKCPPLKWLLFSKLTPLSSRLAWLIKGRGTLPVVIKYSVTHHIGVVSIALNYSRQVK